jgi:hypothetical protein
MQRAEGGFRYELHHGLGSTDIPYDVRTDHDRLFTSQAVEVATDPLTYAPYRLGLAKRAIVARNIFVASGRATGGGFAMLGGGRWGASYGRRAQVLEDALRIAQSEKFINRAKGLGFSEPMLMTQPAAAPAW